LLAKAELYAMGTIMSGWVVLGILVALVLWGIGLYNGLVSMRQRAKQAFADIDVQLKQRHDLIPNLVETVKGYAAHEKRHAGCGDQGAQFGDVGAGPAQVSGQAEAGLSRRSAG
jgi:LemA protein